MGHTGLFTLFTCQPTKGSGVNVRAHLLRKNYSRAYSSIPSGPLFVGICHVLSGRCIGQLYTSDDLGIVQKHLFTYPFL